jgi:GNAT acetyltransferase-like protein
MLVWRPRIRICSRFISVSAPVREFCGESTAPAWNEDCVHRGSMDVLAVPPTAWDERIASPMLSEGFAEASRGVGFRPLFVENERDRALVLLRGIPLPILDRLTERAKVYVSRGDRWFIEALVERLAALNVTHVRIGDERHGLGGPPPEWPNTVATPYHVFLIDAAHRSDKELLAAMSDPVPRNIRKADRAGVEVTEIRTEEEMNVFCVLMAETADRIRRRHIAAVYPDAFFRTVFRRMVPRRQALFLLARADGVPLAAQMYMVCADRLTYYHGASTRARELTPKHGPTAIFWHALRLTRDRGLAVFDMGAGTPTSDRANVHFSVADFKRRWGGRHVEVPSVDIVLAPTRVFLQDRLLKPLWDRGHPLYLRLFDHGQAA